MNKTYDLSRFILAQQRDFETAYSEIKSGKKRSHWMWYIFPQIDGLGYSPTAKHLGTELGVHFSNCLEIINLIM